MASRRRWRVGSISNLPLASIGRLQRLVFLVDDHFAVVAVWVGRWWLVFLG